MRVHYRSRLARIFLPRRYVAVTLGSHVLTTLSHLDERTLRHEGAHIEQWRRYGVFRFPVRYLWCHFRFGYWGNPFEIEARRAEDASR